MASFKVGDKVSASFSLRGEITRIVRKRGIEFAVVRMTDGFAREIPTSNLTKDDA
jgi:hypothetical protein